MKDFFTSVPFVLKKIYAGKNLLWQLCAILLTYIFVVSGFDWLYFISVRNTTVNQLFFPALIVGGLFPVIIPITLILLGMVRKNRTMSVFGWALGQAAFLGWAISSFYKAFTGRMQPNLHDLITNSSNGFHFGILEHGIFWGWPSSHTAVAFAITFAFIALIPKNKKYSRYASVMYALYIGIGVSLSVHWFSEFIAGAIIGAVTGNVVGTEWGKKIQTALS